jgi:hypothetical protein
MQSFGVEEDIVKLSFVRIIVVVMVNVKGNLIDVNVSKV